MCPDTEITKEEEAEIIKEAEADSEVEVEEVEKDSVEEVLPQELEFEGVDTVEDIKKGEEKKYGI